MFKYICIQSGITSRIIAAAIAGLFSYSGATAQAVILNADGPGNTYELITSKFGSGTGVGAVESAECIHPSFGRHITEVFDAELNKFVFQFFIHVTPDNDRCTAATDRQRVEIKTYESSPNNLKGTLGESITYKWRFRIPVGFQPSTSFTHIHQIKPVNGNDGDPLFTLTPRKGNPNKLELIHDNTSKVAIVNLSAFEGVWVEATQFITVGANGVYSMIIKRVSDGVTLLSYTNMNIKTIRPDNDFIRPKWGIYRSLNVVADLRDESILFSDFSIEENTVLPVKLDGFSATQIKNEVALKWKTLSEINTDRFDIERSADGINFTIIKSVPASGFTNAEKNYTGTDASPLTGKNYYRLVSIDTDGRKQISDIKTINFSANESASILIAPNPVSSVAKVDLKGFGSERLLVTVQNSLGKKVFSFTEIQIAAEQKLTAFLPTLLPGTYSIQVTNGNTKSTYQFIKL